jgi:NADH dehydrogenase/NADH:ubiquinone oxidoreductase subunit G
MSAHVTLTVNGSKLKAPAGTSVLDVALEQGICIPHLCHLRGVPEIGACRLCLVERISGGRPQITTSCTLEVQDGMVVHTDTPRIRELRRNVAELLVAEAPDSKAVQDVALRCGVRRVRYPFRNQKCVLCGKCVRLCRDLWRDNAIGFVGRGRQRHVGFAFGQRPGFCQRCRMCATHCPMTTAPCGGHMPVGKEYLCNRCESQLVTPASLASICTNCELGKGFGCARQH